MLGFDFHWSVSCRYESSYSKMKKCSNCLITRRIFHLYTHVYIQSVKQRKKNTFFLNNEPTSLRLEWSCPTSAEMSRRGLPIPRMTAMLTDDGTMRFTSDTGGKSEARRKIFEPNKGGMEQPPTTMAKNNRFTNCWLQNF